MSNINQWQFDELPDSKIIITEKVLNRLYLLIGRTSWIASEHSATLFGRKLSHENTWIIDEVNSNEDYVSRGQDSINPLDYSVSTGSEDAKEIVDKLDSKSGVVVVDVHTHPSGLTDDYRFLSSGDLSTYKEYNYKVSEKGGTFFAGLIGVDRVNGNMTFSIIWYNKEQDKFYLVKDIYLRRKIENGKYVDYPFVKYGSTQLIMQSWSDQDSVIDEYSKSELSRFGRK